MTLIHKAPNADAAKPMTHVLLIGVGDYYHLPGGSKYPAKKAKYPLGLKSLQSPPLSAQALANWMIDKLANSHQNPTVPLGTVDLLLSPPTYTDKDNAKRQVDPATFDEIKRAFNEWLARCHQHPKSIGIFYFCGHGVEWEKTYLLPADYGDDPYTPWSRVIDFNLSRMAFLADCQATTLCSFIDACREIKIDTLDLSFKGHELRSTKTPPGTETRRTLALGSALRRASAWAAPAGRCQLFRAGLDPLSREPGRRRAAQGKVWQVNTNSLTLAMQQLMSRTQIPDIGFGECESHGHSNTGAPTVLHHLPGLAAALAEITYDPEEALGYADIFYRLTGAADPRTARPVREPSPWQIEVLAGTYELTAEFPGQEYADRNVTEQTIHPPFTPCKI